MTLKDGIAHLKGEVDRQLEFIKWLKSEGMYNPMESAYTMQRMEKVWKKLSYMSLLKEAISEFDTSDNLEKYEICLLPDFGNRDIIIKTVKEMKIATTGKTRPSGFIGCCVPVILDIVCSEEDRKKLKDKLDEVATASCDIIKRCPTCGYIH